MEHGRRRLRLLEAAPARLRKPTPSAENMHKSNNLEQKINIWARSPVNMRHAVHVHLFGALLIYWFHKCAHKSFSMFSLNTIPDSGHLPLQVFKETFVRNVGFQLTVGSVDRS